MRLKSLYYITCILFFIAVQALAQEKIKIGVSSALTGNAASYGVDIKNVLLFANEKLANNKYDLVFDDDKCNGRDAVAVAHRFIDVLKLKYVIGFACSSTVLSTAQLYEKAGVLVMVTSASAADISKAGDFIFRTWSSDSGAAKTLYEYVSRKHKKFGVLTEQTDFAEGFLRLLEKNNKSGMIEIVNESYLTDSSDYRSLILKLKSKDVDSIFINSQTEATFLAVLKQVKESGWNPQVYSAYWGGTSAVLQKSNGLAEGSIYVDLPSVDDSLTDEGKILYSEFKRKFVQMQSVDLMFGTVFEAFRALHLAIESGAEIREYLYSKRFKGIIGEWYFDKNGDIQGLDFMIKTVKNSKGRRATE